MNFRALFRSLTPQFILDKYRTNKKRIVDAQLSKDASEGNFLTRQQLIQDLKLMGIVEGDSLLLHCSMSKIGYLENGPQTLIDALLAALGASGNLLMPTSPNKSLQLAHVQQTTVFDSIKDKSQMGAISEAFRTMKGVHRSLNPVEPVSAFGPDAIWLTEGHLGEKSAYTANSPFARLKDLNGKIAYVGVTLDNAGTSLHLLEDAVENFRFPVYFPDEFEQTVIDENGKSHFVNVKVHNPEMSKQRKCDGLLPWFKENGVYEEFTLGKANVMLFDAKKMYDLMLEGYKEKGITMYTPKGG
ncbi:MAG: AAC(3) family N-acetyltransferase [Bacteroidota bacterium]